MSTTFLLQSARAASRFAHAPYSRFRVGAALLSKDGSILTGANVENASYPLGICAERVALLRWRARNATPIVTIALFTPTRRPTPPCGLCRDALMRWAPEARLIQGWSSGVTDPVAVSELLPALRAES